MNQTTSNSWITYSEITVAPALRLFCIPYAGGNASLFDSWPALLPKRVQACAVELPGRRRRFGETAYTSMPPLVHDFAAVLEQYVDIPYAIFGISFGALIGFELAHEMKKLGHPPLHLFVANCHAPHLRDPDPPIHALPDSDLLANIECLGATPDAVLQHPELMKLMLPMLRADFKVAATYAYSPKPTVAFPITAFLGSEDPTLTRELLLPWGEHTQGPFRLEVIPGNHYLTDIGRDALLQSISAELNYCLEANSSAGRI